MRPFCPVTEIKETIPNKPIRYVINSHVHFDHSGGLCTYVDEGATVVTHQMNQPYFEQAWAAPRTLNPDRLAQSKKAAKFETVTDKHVLTDSKRNIEIRSIAGSGHNDAFLMIYRLRRSTGRASQRWRICARRSASRRIRTSLSRSG